MLNERQKSPTYTRKVAYKGNPRTCVDATQVLYSWHKTPPETGALCILLWDWSFMYLLVTSWHKGVVSRLHPPRQGCHASLHPPRLQLSPVGTRVSSFPQLAQGCLDKGLLRDTNPWDSSFPCFFFGHTKKNRGDLWRSILIIFPRCLSIMRPRWKKLGS